MGVFHNYFANIYLPCGSRGGVRLKVSLSSSQCTLLHPKNILLLPKMVLLFLELHFYFPELPFCFPEVFSFYLLSASFSKDDFFNWLHLLLVLLKSAQRDNIFIGSSWDPLLNNLWCLPDNLKASTWSMIFYVFSSKFRLHESLENAVSEHLKWLKFQIFSGGSAPIGRGAVDPPAASHTAYGSVKKRTLKLKKLCPFQCIRPCPFFLK